MAQTVCVIINTAERERLAAIVADRKRPRKRVERARIVLAWADRGSAQRVARSTGVSRPSVWRWRQRFAEAGSKGGGEAGGGVVGDLAQADAVGPRPPSSASTAPTASILP